MFNHPLEMPLLTYKGSFSNGKLQASILESVPFRGLVHHSVPFRRIVPTGNVRPGTTGNAWDSPSVPTTKQASQMIHSIVCFVYKTIMYMLKHSRECYMKNKVRGARPRC